MVFNRRETLGFGTAGTGALDPYHTEESNSPWNSPVFVKKKSGKR